MGTVPKNRCDIARRALVNCLLSFIAIAVAPNLCLASDSTASVQKDDSVEIIAPAQHSGPQSIAAMQPPRTKVHRIGSIAMKAFLGAGIGYVGMISGAALSMYAESGFRKNPDSECWAGILGGGFLGYLFLEPAGVWLGGKIFGEKGAYWSAFQGTIAGCTVGLAVTGLSRQFLIGVPVMVTVSIPWSIHTYDHPMKPLR
jgi:hypothetical protein